MSQVANPDAPAGVCVLGATGSIGRSTLDVVARHPEQYRVHALTANASVESMAELCRRFRPVHAVMADAAAAERLATALRDSAPEVRVRGGVESLNEVAADPGSSVVMAAIVGAAGLLPTLSAVRAGKRVLLANKEALVMAGALMMREVESAGATLLPIDSEHNAVFQCLPGMWRQGADQDGAGVRRILLTASGGPFRSIDPARLTEVTPEQACAHPNWSMGRKISVDSATMMNKGLEVIEACWLFGVNAGQVEVVIHPQSVVHSMVAYSDGSVLAQMGNPDMRTPIAHALAWPRRIDSGVSALDLTAVARLDFEAPDPQRFPCLAFAYQALKQGGNASLTLNAANEVAVAAFLDGAIGFTDIPRVIEHCLDQVNPVAADSIDGLVTEDLRVRQLAEEQVQRLRRVV